jgi:hypothetical protein
MSETISKAEQIASALRRARRRIDSNRQLATDKALRARLAEELRALSVAARLFRSVTSQHIDALAVPPDDMTVQEGQLWEEAMLALRAAFGGEAV